jgi:integrase/recombinase XerD
MIIIQTTLEEFIAHCKFEKSLSEKTLKAYNIDLMQFTKFLIEKNLPLDVKEITKSEIRGFLESISSLKPKSIKRKIATIKAMFNYLEFEDKISVSPLRKMRIRIKEPYRLPKVMAIQDVNAIFKSAYKKKNILNIDSHSYFEYYRNIVVVELLFATGSRVSEIANLREENIDLVLGAVTIRGKGNKERIIQICNLETLQVLRQYRSLFINKIRDAEGFFLVNRLGKKLSDQSIRTIVKHLAHKAKIKKHITPHVFRHSFATLLLEKDVDIKYIQSLLGHSSIMTTQIYTHVNRAKQRQILKMKHPRKDFSMTESLVS